MLVRLDVVAPSAQHLEVVDVVLKVRVRLAGLDVIHDRPFANFITAHPTPFAISSPLSLGFAA